MPIKSLAPDEAEAHFDWLAMFVGIRNPTSSGLTRQRIGWDPRERGLIDDIRKGDYFARA